MAQRHLCIEDGLFLIPLDLDLKGFRHFISAWLYIDQKRTIVVDPGPKATIPPLLEALEERDISHLDYVLLTHIHVDHAGGAGMLLNRYPEAVVVCHPKAVAHLIDPTHLWEASRKVLGPVAEAYGEFTPVDAQRIATSVADRDGTLIQCIETPGHAVHHMSYLVRHILFAGECVGVYYELAGGMWYLRPATPPVFKLDLWLASLQTLAQYCPEILCVGHFGMSRSPLTMIAAARDQLLRWTDTVRSYQHESEERIIEKSLKRLLEEDPHFSLFRSLDEDIQERERYFLTNTIQGILGYVRQCTTC